MIRRNIDPLLNGIEVLVTKDMRSRCLIPSLIDYTGKPSLLQESRPLRHMGKSGARKTYPWRRTRLSNI